MVYLNIDTIPNPNRFPPPQSSSSSTSTSKHRLSSKGTKAATVALASLPFILLLLDLWRVPIIILIATTGAQPAFAGSLAAVSLSNSSDTYDTEQGKQPSKLSFNSNEGGLDGNGSSVGLLSLSFGGLAFNHNYQQQPKEPSSEPSSSAKKAGIVKRGGGETRITSNQDVTTLALAVENSSSVAIANINSSWNNVYVSIGTPTGNQFQYPPQPNK